MIETYDLEVFTPSCDPGAERFTAKARLKVDISEVLPYLNATLRRGSFYTYEVDLRVGKTTVLANSTTAPPWVSGAHRINELDD